MDLTNPHGPTVAERLATVALDRDLRPATVISYRRLLARCGLLDRPVSAIGREQAAAALWTIDNPNTRRSAAIAIRSVLGLDVRIPKAIPRHYTLPDEDTLRLALMTSPHEPRGLLMMYAGLRVGEACAITHRDLHGDHLRVDKQVQVLTETGTPTRVVIGPVKCSEATVVVPDLLIPVIASLDTTARPDHVRESLRRAGQRVGIALNPHQLRHWYATTLLRRGAPMSLVSRQMRHSDIATTLRTYSNHDVAEVKGFFDV